MNRKVGDPCVYRAGDLEDFGHLISRHYSGYYQPVEERNILRVGGEYMYPEESSLRVLQTDLRKPTPEELEKYFTL